jgi:hypothetical protein
MFPPRGLGRVLNCFGDVAQNAVLHVAFRVLGRRGQREPGSDVVSGVDLYSIVKELVGTVEPPPQNEFQVVPERDRGVARGPGGPPHF